MGDFAADGTVVHSTDLNKVLKVAGVGGPVVGSSPPAAGASSAYLVAAGSAVTTTNASGGFAVTYATAFPNGVLSVVATVGDTNLGSDMTVVFIQANQTKTGFQGIVTLAGAVVNTQSVRLDYIAIGW